MNTPLISIIVLTYENTVGIYRTLDSILKQDYRNFELTISDDFSSTFPIADIEAYLFGKNIRYTIRRNECNLGTVAHCNLAAAKTSGEFIKFLASGDGFCKKSSLRELVEFAQKNSKFPAITSVSKVCNEDFSTEYYEFPSLRRVNILNKTPSDKLYEKLIFSNIISAAGSLFRRVFFTRYHGFDTEYRLLEDWPTWLRLTRNGMMIPCYPQATVYYALGGVSSKKGTAFESVSLRRDMILCYEKEILPYIKKLPFICRTFAFYQHKKLVVYENGSTFNKVSIYVHYFPFEIYRSGKAVVKKILFTIRGGE